MTCIGTKKNGLPCTYKCYNSNLCGIHKNVKKKKDVKQFVSSDKRLPIIIRFRYCNGIIKKGSSININIKMCQRSCIHEKDGSFGCHYHKKQMKDISREVYYTNGKISIIKQIKDFINTKFQKIIKRQQKERNCIDKLVKESKQFDILHNQIDEQVKQSNIIKQQEEERRQDDIRRKLLLEEDRQDDIRRKLLLEEDRQDDIRRKLQEDERKQDDIRRKLLLEEDRQDDIRRKLQEDERKQNDIRINQMVEDIYKNRAEMKEMIQELHKSNAELFESHRLRDIELVQLDKDITSLEEFSEKRKNSIAELFVILDATRTQIEENKVNGEYIVYVESKDEDEYEYIDEDEDESEYESYDYHVPVFTVDLDNNNRVTPVASTNTSNCCICLDDDNEHSKLKTNCCNHIYHHNCLTDWLTRQHTCPSCRTQLSH